jgi:hypothetical protein
MRPLCLASASYIPSNLVCYVTLPSRAQKKDRTSQGGRTIGRGFERKARDAIHHPSLSASWTSYHHSVSEPDRRVNHRQWQQLHDKSRLEFGRAWSFSANAGRQHDARPRSCQVDSTVFVWFVWGQAALQHPSSPDAQPLWRVGNGSMGSFGFHCGCRQLCESRQISRLT